MPNCPHSSPKASDPNYVCNQKTGKWIKRDGVVARREKIGAFASVATKKPKAKYKAKAHVAKIKMPTPIGTTTTITPPTAPIATYTMEERLINACKGKTYRNGGLNLGDLLRLAISNGYTKKRGSRTELLKFLCTGGSASASASAKAKAKASPKAKAKASPKPKAFSITDCSNTDYDPFSADELSDCEEGIIALPSRIKGNKPICFCKETIWNYFKTHVNHDLHVFQAASKNNYSGIPPIDMSVMGSVSNILELKEVKTYLTQRSKLGIKNKEFKDPNALYETERIAKGYVWGRPLSGYPTATAEKLIGDFIMQRIDTEGDLHIEKLTQSLLGEYTGAEAHLNIGSTPPSALTYWISEWVQLVQVIYGSWISQDPSIAYLGNMTDHVRYDIDTLSSDEEKRKLIGILLIDMYNAIITQTKSAEIAKNKLILLLYAMQQLIQ